LIGAVLPQKMTTEILSSREKEYFANYSSILTDYNEAIGLDITSDLEV
jgi:hypothetical protein